MASSWVMTSSSSAGSDLARQSGLYSVGRLSDLDGDRRRNDSGSANMDDLLRNFYAESSGGGGSTGDGNSTNLRASRGRQEGFEVVRGERDGAMFKRESISVPKVSGRRTAEEVWNEISRDRKVEFGTARVHKEELEELTLEDYLARAGELKEDNSPSSRVLLQPQVSGSKHRFAVDASVADRSAQENQQHQAEGSFPGFEHDPDSGAGGRGKRKMMADPVDQASQQKQKRMIKNRESAARSRERKQAYIQQLETLAARLEEEKAALLEEQAQRRKARLKHLMENAIPVVERERPPPPPRLRRTCSLQW